MEDLRALALVKFKPETQKLTEEATQEAREHNFDPQKYKQIITFLQNSSYQKLFIKIMQDYNAGAIDLEKLFIDNSTARLVSLYPHYKNQLLSAKADSLGLRL